MIIMKQKIFLLLILLPISAHAYTDPGTGMLLIQGLLIAIGTVIAFVKNPILTLKNLWKHFFSRGKGAKNEEKGK